MSKWWLANWRDPVAFASRHPAHAIRSVFRDLLALDERFLGRLTGARAAQIKGFLSEPFQDQGLYGHFRDVEKQLEGTRDIGANLYAKRVLLQYAIVRASRPGRILETGIANGVSLAYLLLAMECNQKDSLHSIDVNDGSFLPLGKRVGWIVPEWLRHRWTVHLGDARELLPQLLAQVGPLDVFIHDSLHTYDHVKFEYEQPNPCLRPASILMAGDAGWNTVFLDFALAPGTTVYNIIRGVGVLKKQHEIHPIVADQPPWDNPQEKSTCFDL